MAGTEGAKHSKSKGKSKSKNPDAINQEPEQISTKNPDGPNDSIDKNPHPDMNSSTLTRWSKYTEKELEQFLLLKLERSYLKVKGWLLESGYGIAEIDRAILKAGYVNNTMDPENNLLANLISFIDGKFVPKREAFKDMDQLYNTMLRALVLLTTHYNPNIERSNAMRLLLLNNWDSLPPPVVIPQLQTENAEKVLHESNIGILRRVELKPALVSRLRQTVPILAAALQGQIGAPVSQKHVIPNAVCFFTSIEGISFITFLRAWLESNLGDDSVTPELVDLVKTISELYEEVKEQKEWAEKKLMDSAKRVSEDLLELKMLRMNTKKLNSDKMIAEKNEALSALKITQVANCLYWAHHELNHLIEAKRRLEIQNAEIRADTEAFKLNASESERELKVVLKREGKCMKKLAEIEKQKSIFQQQFEVEKQRVLQLELELLRAEKEAEEAEIQWRQEIVEKEQMRTLLDEEIEMAETQKASSRTELLQLQQKVEIENQIALDDCRRLEDELSSFRLVKTSDVILEDDIFLYRSLEGPSSESNAPYEKISHWNCMTCIDTEVNVVFLPCTHQVVCFSCYEDRYKVRGQCPYCGSRIEQSIRIYGAST